MRQSRVFVEDAQVKMMPDRDPILVFHNRGAVFIWGFAAVWLGMLGMMSYLLHRDGFSNAHSEAVGLLVIGAFWVAGAGLVLLVMSKPIYSVHVHANSGIAVRWQYPHRVVHEVIPRSRLVRAIVVESDSDSGLYYFARVVVRGGKPVNLVEGHQREACEQACTRFNDALFASPPGAHTPETGAGRAPPALPRH